MRYPQLPAYDAERFHAVVDHSGPFEVLDLSTTYDPAAIDRAGWAIGRYDERRQSEMYVSDLYEDGRDLHVGIDLWAPAGTPVYAFASGIVYAVADNAGFRDYGPTVVTEHTIGDILFWALWGHLSRKSIESIETGMTISRGSRIGSMGSSDENGGWAPHLHLQLSVVPPHGADMPGVVRFEHRVGALQLYPDPRYVLGPIY